MTNIFFSKIFPAGFILVGLIFFALGVVQFFEAKATSSWPSVEGRVLSAKVESKSYRNSDGMSSSKFRPVVKYSYSVDGIDYEGARLEIGNQYHGKPRRAQEAIAAYKKDKACTVYFDPNDPESAVLENGVQLANVFFFLLPIGLFAVGILSAICIPYAIRQEEAKKMRIAAYQKEKERLGA